MIMNVGIAVDYSSDLYKKAQALCEGIEVKFGKDITIPFPMQQVDTGCGTDDCNALRMYRQPRLPHPHPKDQAPQDYHANLILPLYAYLSLPKSSL